MRNKWLQAINQKDFTPSETATLCSAHFTEDCFNRTLNVTRLRIDAVPTIFPLSKQEVGIFWVPFRSFQTNSESND